MYFAKFPIITYPFEIDGKLVSKQITDITLNVRIIKSILQNITSYDEYDLKEGETIEMISEKAYGSPLYHWVIMIANERYDYVNDYPLSQYELEQYVLRKYGSWPDAQDTHHYIDDNGNIVNYENKDVFGITTTIHSVSNYEYESQINESKRRIKLISPENLFRIMAQFKSLI